MGFLFFRLHGNGGGGAYMWCVCLSVCLSRLRDTKKFI